METACRVAPSASEADPGCCGCCIGLRAVGRHAAWRSAALASGCLGDGSGQCVGRYGWPDYGWPTGGCGLPCGWSGAAARRQAGIRLGPLVVHALDAFVDADYRNRAEPADIIAALRALQPANLKSAK